MFKKFLALITLTLIAVSALTGCGTSSPQGNTEKTLIIGMKKEESMLISHKHILKTDIRLSYAKIMTPFTALMI